MRQHSAGRMEKVAEAVIPEIARAIAAHPETVSLGQGVVFYPPPPTALEYARRRMAADDRHVYGPVAGLPELHEAIAAKLAAHNGIQLGTGQTLFVTAGANMAFNALMLAVCDPGDEVILLLPYYFNHEMTATMCGCKVKCVPTGDDYHPLVENIKDAITGKTRAIVTVSPNNPSGAVYPERSLRAINALCAERGICHISDEAYEDFTFGGRRHFSPASQAGTEDHTVSLFSMSKSHGFASWRIGYMVAPRRLHDALTKIQDNVLICPPAISQFAAIECLNHGARYIRQMKQTIDANRELCLDKLAPLIARGLISAPPAEGGMYLFVRLNTGLDDTRIAHRLIAEHRVAAIPGSAFGAACNPSLRISYGALTTARLRTGIERLVRGLRAILKAPA